jgi:hypothetical protein
MLFWTHMGLTRLTVPQFTLCIRLNTVSFLQIYAVESDSILQACGFLQKHTMSSIDFAVAC